MSRKVRMSVSLEASEKAVLEKIAMCRGVSASAVLREIVAASYEPLSRLAGILEAATMAEASYRQGLRKTLDDTGDDVAKLHKQAMDLLDAIDPPKDRKDH